MQLRIDAKRPRKCGAILFALMDFGHLSATMRSLLGMLRLARFLVGGTPMMTSFKIVMASPSE